MSRRTWLMLMIVTGAVFGLGAVKVLQIQAAIAQASSFQPPPEAVTTILARSEQWPTTIAAIGTARAVRGVRLSADLPGVVEALTFDSGRPVRGGRAARAPRRAPGAGAARRRGGAARARAREPRARARAGEPGDRGRGRARPRERRAQAGRGSRGRDPRHHRAQADSRAVLGSAGDPAGRPGAVPERGRRGRLAAGDRPDLRELQRAAAAARRGARRTRGARERRGPGRPGDAGPHHRGRLGGGRGDAQRAGAGDARQPEGRAAPRHVRRDARRDG